MSESVMESATPVAFGRSTLTATSGSMKPISAPGQA